jgi:GNAT superfamily N-acetyltransferase
MHEVTLNDESSATTYLDGLNRCFPGWGDRQRFDWVFSRSCGSHPPDRFLVTDEVGEVLAGTGTSYRKLALASAAVVDVGIMTGSWTLPAARGRGIFATLIEESRRRCQELGCALLLAYVTHDNPSRRALERAGSAMFPTWYLHGAPADLAPVAEPAEPVSLPAGYATDRDARLAGFTRVVYPSAPDFEGQFIERPDPVSVVGADDGVAILEDGGDTWRTLSHLSRTSRAALLRALGATSATAGRRLFAFTSAEGVPAWLDGTPGFLTVLLASEEALLDATGAAGPVGSSEGLADPTGPHYIGPWFLEAGDRM